MTLYDWGPHTSGKYAGSITFWVRTFLGMLPIMVSHSDALRPASTLLTIFVPSPLPTLWESESPAGGGIWVHSPTFCPILSGRTHMASSLVSAHKWRREPSRRFTVSRPSRLRPSGGCTSKGRHTHMGIPRTTGPRSPIKIETRIGIDLWVLILGHCQPPLIPHTFFWDSALLFRTFQPFHIAYSPC